MSFNNKFYDVLKSVALVWLPALTSLYFAIASIWGIPNVANVIGTMTSVDTFLGVVLGLSSRGYSPPVDGKVFVDADGPKKVQVDLTPAEVAGKDSITLSVHPEEAIQGGAK